jgi:FKBP-type peptidyl-prolyl cis-trans isomerase 2
MTAQKGNKVKLHYRGTLADGSVFDTSFNGDPLEFTLGSGMLIAGFENGVIGMQVGEKKKIFVPTEDAYGKRTDELIIEFPKESIPDDAPIEIGTLMRLQLTPDQSVNVEVIEIKENSVVFDANHQLADQDLNFEIELLSIE